MNTSSRSRWPLVAIGDLPGTAVVEMTEWIVREGRDLWSATPYFERGWMYPGFKFRFRDPVDAVYFKLRWFDGERVSA